MNGFQKSVIKDALDNNEERLTDWEWDFINDLAECTEDYVLSEKQNHILNRIAEKIGQ